MPLSRQVTKLIPPDTRMEKVMSTESPVHFEKEAHVSKMRSFAKTISWRVLGSIDTFVITYLVTGEAKYGAFVASAEVVTKIFLYYFHERAWAHIRWGVVKN